jgi:hypothetical protein
MRISLSKKPLFHPPSKTGAFDSTHLCVRCSRRTLSSTAIPGTSPLRQTYRKYSTLKDELPFAERLRRKIWGTDNPPGLKNPYGEGSQLRRETRPGQTLENERVREEEPADVAEEAAGKASVSGPPLDEWEGYKPATTWDGLRSIGGPTGWWEEAWDAEHQFSGYDEGHYANMPC